MSVAQYQAKPATTLLPPGTARPITSLSRTALQPPSALAKLMRSAMPLTTTLQPPSRGPSPASAAAAAMPPTPPHKPATPITQPSPLSVVHEETEVATTAAPPVAEVEMPITAVVVVAAAVESVDASAVVVEAAGSEAVPAVELPQAEPITTTQAEKKKKSKPKRAPVAKMLTKAGGATRRHQWKPSVTRDTYTKCIRVPYVRTVATRAGLGRMTGELLNIGVATSVSITELIVGLATIYMQHQNLKTLKQEHVKRAAKKIGMTLLC